ncbi:MAG: EAL domain-containing protein, partial [Halomonas sp.]
DKLICITHLASWFYQFHRHYQQQSTPLLHGDANLRNFNVRSLTALSQGLGIKTVAEGVETQRQRDYLDALDVDDIQGFLLARPMEPQACLAFLQAHARAMVVN